MKLISQSPMKWSISTTLHLKLVICEFMIISISSKELVGVYLFHENVITFFTRDVFNFLLYVKALANLKSLHKKRKFHLILPCGNFVKTHSFCRVSGESPETLRKLYVLTKFLHQKSKWNYSISCSEWLMSIPLL